MGENGAPVLTVRQPVHLFPNAIIVGNFRIQIILIFKGAKYNL